LFLVNAPVQLVLEVGKQPALLEDRQRVDRQFSGHQGSFTALRTDVTAAHDLQKVAGKSVHVKLAADHFQQLNTAVHPTTHRSPGLQHLIKPRQPGDNLAVNRCEIAARINEIPQFRQRPHRAIAA